MTQIIGTCACYPDGNLTYCNYYDSMECSPVSGNCGGDAFKPSNILLLQVTEEGAPNGKEPDWVHL